MSTRKEKWAKAKPFVLYFSACAAVTGVCVCLVLNMSSKDELERLQAERKQLKEDLFETEGVAWDYFDITTYLIDKYKPSSEELQQMTDGLGIKTKGL